MQVLHVCSEMFPLLKTGGLADVIGALPAAQIADGTDARQPSGLAVKKPAARAFASTCPRQEDLRRSMKPSMPRPASSMA